MHPHQKQAKYSQKTKMKSMTMGYAEGGNIGPKAPDYGSVTGAKLSNKWGKDITKTMEYLGDEITKLNSKSS